MIKVSVQREENRTTNLCKKLDSTYIPIAIERQINQSIKSGKLMIMNSSFNRDHSLSSTTTRDRFTAMASGQNAGNASSHFESPEYQAYLRTVINKIDQSLDINNVGTSSSVHHSLGPPPDFSSSSSSSSSSNVFAHNFAVAFSLIERDIFTYPLCVLRKTCQINQLSGDYLSPFSALSLLNRTRSRYGVSGLTKGLPSLLMNRGLFLGTQNLLRQQGLSGLLCFPTAHLILTPFYCAGTIETVQSSFASESQGLLSFVRSSLSRILYWSQISSSRIVPIYLLVGPTVVYEILFALSTDSLKKLYYQSGFCGRKSNSNSEILYEKMMLSIACKFLTTLALYPLETILHRLYIQGTRTLIDNFDNDFKVIPVISNYEGVNDCYESIMVTEGCAGLYKGLGFLFLQFGLEYAVIRLLKPVLNNFF